MLDTSKIDILCLSESWLTDNVMNSEIEVPGYKTIRKDRTKKKGGGLLIYVKSYISAELISSDNINTQDDLEMIWVQVKIKFTMPIVLGLLYKPPKTPTGSALRILSSVI